MLFSTVVALLSLVVFRVRNSVHASYQLLEQDISVGVKAVYNRLNSLPIALIEALVRESALRIFAIVDAVSIATVEEVQSHLPELADRVAAGHQINIYRDGKPVCPVVWEGRSRKAPPYPDFSIVRPPMGFTRGFLLSYFLAKRFKRKIRDSSDRCGKSATQQPAAVTTARESR